MKFLTSFLFSIILTINILGQSSKLVLGLSTGFDLTSLKLTGNNILDISSLYQYREAILVGQVLNLNPSFTFTGNFSVEYVFSPFFSLETDIEIQQISNHQDMSYTNYSSNESPPPVIPYSLTFNYDFINIPLLIKFSTTGKVRYYIDTGPYFGLEMKHSIVQSTIGTIYPAQTFNTNYANNDRGILFGVGSSIPINNQINIDFEIRENYGLNNINNVDYIWCKMFTRSTGLLIGVKFKI